MIKLITLLWIIMGIVITAIVFIGLHMINLPQGNPLRNWVEKHLITFDEDDESV